MNPGIISTYLDSRMRETGHCGGYALRIRHYMVPATETLAIAAWNEIFILLDEAPDVRIESDLGIYDTGVAGITSEQQHEHTGQITLTNHSNESSIHVQFVQAIPLEANPDCKPCNPND